MSWSGARRDLASTCYGHLFWTFLSAASFRLPQNTASKCLNDTFRAMQWTVTNENPCWTAAKYCMSKFP